MKARTFVRKTNPKAQAKKLYEGMPASSKPITMKSWVITDNSTTLGEGKTKTEAWEDARARIEKNIPPVEAQPLSKQEAMQKMREGKKVTHDYFTDDECMWLEDGMYCFEDGVKCTISEFWTYRSGPSWETGWYEYVENTEKLKIS